MSNRKKRKGFMKGALFPKSGLVQNVTMPDDEKELLKQVPAKVDGTVVGVANLYDDGSVDVMLDADAPQWAIDKIKATEMEMGYTVGLNMPEEN